MLILFVPIFGAIWLLIELGFLAGSRARTATARR
jgi:hypothetical protein